MVLASSSYTSAQEAMANTASSSARVLAWSGSGAAPGEASMRVRYLLARRSGVNRRSGRWGAGAYRRSSGR